MGGEENVFVKSLPPLLIYIKSIIDDEKFDGLIYYGRFKTNR